MTDLRWPTYKIKDVVLDSFVPHERGSLHLRDSEGRVYLDAVNGIGCAPLGHGHPEWIAAIHRQMQTLMSVSNAYLTGPQQRFAELLRERYPIPDARAFYCNTGAESTEAAIKLVLKATGRDTIIAFEGAFHGRTLGALSCTANASYRAPYVADLGDPQERFARARVLRLPFDDTSALEAAFAEHGARIASVFIEPVQGEGGIFPASKAFLVRMRELCDRHGALVALDEVQAGSGRTGHWSAWTAIVGDDIKPDCTWLAKALGGGFPVAVCLATPKLAEAMQPGSHGTTFGGNPVACAAGVATIEIMEREGLLASASQQASIIRELATERPIAEVTEIRAIGAMIGIQVGSREAGRAQVLVDALMKRGVLVTVCNGHSVRCLFPYRAGREELSTLWTALEAAIADTAGAAA
jgi:acetylornithine/N-succinyldiaminopimelate aminotransferase